MKKHDKAIIEYLEMFGQPQTWEAIRDRMADMGYEGVERDDVDALVSDKEITIADGGVDSRGEAVTLYAPKGFKD